MIKKKKPKERGLNPREMRFCQEYVKSGSKRGAALKAGYAAKNCDTYGSRLYKVPRVREEIDRLMAESADRNELNTNDIIQSLMAIAFVKVDEFIESFDGKTLIYKPIERWTERAKLALMPSVEFKPNGQISKIPAPDRLAALGQLGTISGLTRDLNVSIANLKLFGHSFTQDETGQLQYLKMDSEP